MNPFTGTCACSPVFCAKSMDLIFLEQSDLRVAYIRCIRRCLSDRIPARIATSKIQRIVIIEITEEERTRARRSTRDQATVRAMSMSTTVAMVERNGASELLVIEQNLLNTRKRLCFVLGDAVLIRYHHFPPCLPLTSFFVVHLFSISENRSVC